MAWWKCISCSSTCRRDTSLSFTPLRSALLVHWQWFLKGWGISNNTSGSINTILGYQSLIILWLPADKNWAQYSMRFITLQWPLIPQGHFKSLVCLYLQTPVYYTRCVRIVCVCVCVRVWACPQSPAVTQKHWFNTKIKRRQTQRFSMQSYLFCFAVKTGSDCSGLFTEEATFFTKMWKRRMLHIQIHKKNPIFFFQNLKWIPTWLQNSTPLSLFWKYIQKSFKR